LTESLADRISRYFVLNNIAEEDDLEVLAYMLFLMFSNMQQIFAFIVVAIVFNAFPQTIAFVLFLQH